MMAGNIIWYITMFGCAALFVGIGIYAKKLEKPMWFWSGSTVDPATITDVKAYNLENSRMWICYSVWYWIAGFAWIWNAAAALTVDLKLALGEAAVALVLYLYTRRTNRIRRQGILQYIDTVTGSVDSVWWAFLIAEMFSLLLTGIFFTRVYNNVIRKL